MTESQSTTKLGTPATSTPEQNSARVGKPVVAKHTVLKRPRINQELAHIFEYPLTVVVAGMGYGKTTSVRAFLDAHQAKYVWLSAEDDQASAQHIWDSLTRQLARTYAEPGRQLNALGFPIDAPQRGRVISLLEEYAYLSDTVVVIDDYHRVHSPEFDSLLERVLRADIVGLRFVLISRTRPDINIDELLLKGYCYLPKSELFEMSAGEIRDYFAGFQVSISDGVALQVHQMTEGWITAVYLLLQRYLELGRVELGTSVEGLMEKAIMPRYSGQEVQLLSSLCILDSFTPDQAAYVIGDSAAPAILQRISASNSFIRYDAQVNVYRLHTIFRAFLRKRLDEQADSADLTMVYSRSGEWHLRHGDPLTGLQFFLRAGAYDLILKEFEQPRMTRVFDTFPQDIVKLFADIPEDVKYRHPIGYIAYAEFYLTDVDPEGGARLLAAIEEHYQRDDSIPLALKQRIKGEIQLVKNSLAFNDIREMYQLHVEAHQLLGGSSSIANKDMIFTFGSPHVLYLYHREKGELRWLVDYVNVGFHYYCQVSNGCGTGFEHLANAEYSLEIGDFAQAASFAQKAIYKAQTMNQVSIIICASFVLARLCVAQGKYAEARELLNSLNRTEWEYINPVLRSSIELCAGYLAGILGETEGVADWLKNGDMQQSEIFYQGMAFNYIVHAKSVLLAKNYLKLEVLCEEMQQLFSMFNNLFGFLHAHLLDAAAKYRLHGLGEAREPMLAALDIGRADGIVLPFAEYGVHILDILTALHHENANDRYLQTLVQETTRYAAQLAGRSVPAITLSKREQAVLQLLVQGKTNKEIASALFIAEVTVKKNITSIYRKLDASGRATAVKKALELQLV